MAGINELENEIESLQKQLAALQNSLEHEVKKNEVKLETQYLYQELKKCRSEASTISHHLDDWIKGYEYPWKSKNRFSLNRTST